MNVKELQALLAGFDGELEVFVRSEAGTMRTTAARAAYEEAGGPCASKLKLGENCWGDAGWSIVFEGEDDAGSVTGIIIE